MPRPRSGQAAAPPSSTASSAPPYSPDLLAKSMYITAVRASGKIFVSALVENIGLGRASGPFSISMFVTIHRGGGITEIAQTVDVPASVSLAGRPVFQYALAGGIVSGTAFQTTYVSPKMEVPLYFRDSDGVTYDAGFLVDSENQVVEANEANNYFEWDHFWFLSAAARARRPVTREA